MRNTFCPHCAREWIIVYERSVYGAPCKKPGEHRKDWKGAHYVLNQNGEGRRLLEAVRHD